MRKFVIGPPSWKDFNQNQALPKAQYVCPTWTLHRPLARAWAVPLRWDLSLPDSVCLYRHSNERENLHFRQITWFGLNAALVINCAAQRTVRTRARSHSNSHGYHPVRLRDPTTCQDVCSGSRQTSWQMCSATSPTSPSEPDSSLNKGVSHVNSPIPLPVTVYLFFPVPIYWFMKRKEHYLRLLVGTKYLYMTWACLFCVNLFFYLTIIKRQILYSYRY